jgi:drug/metabolite transporter (DMT)-like permease
MFLGDLCGVIAAALWASTTVAIRATRLARATATKTLFYQLALSARIAFVLNGFGRKRRSRDHAPRAGEPRLPGRLSFLTPMFGVLSGVVFLSEPVSATFVFAALLIAAGIVLVNLRR